MVRLARVLLILLLALVVVPPPAQANWLTRLGHAAGESGAVASKAARLGAGALERAAAAVKAHPATAKTAALGAHVTPEGHWNFVNAAGETFTAGTAEELARAVPRLAPEVAEGKSGLTLYLTEGTVFEGRAKLKELPKDAELRVVVGPESYKVLRRKAADGSEALYADVRGNIAVAMNDVALFDEAVWQLQRPLNKADIRVVALEPGGPELLSSSPRFEPGGGNALVDTIDPGRLAGALSRLRGQTVLVTGAVEGEVMRYTPARGGSETLRLKEVIQAAEANDVNLVILQSSAPRQPGGRNWLWQRVAVKGLDEAIRRATFADFLDAIAARRGELLVTASNPTSPRVQLTALPSGASAAPVGKGLTEWAGNIASEWTASITPHVTGEVMALAVHAHLVDAERQKELQARLVPYVPSWVQGWFLVGVVAGLIAWPVSSRWWRRIWPPEARADYPRRMGFVLARLTRAMAFLALFLPVAGLPALLTLLALQLWEGVLLPVRLIRRLTGGGKGAA